MIGSNPRKRRAMDKKTDRSQRLVDENMIDRDGGEGGRKGARWSGRMDKLAHFAEMTAKCLVRTGPRGS